MTHSDRCTCQCSAYMKISMSMLMFARHTGQQSSVISLFAQLSQKRACPHGTSENPSRGATRHTSQQSAGSSAAAAAGSGAGEVVAVDAVDCSSASSSSALLSLSVAGYNAAVWAPTEWLTARRNCRRLYAPVSNLVTHALIRNSFTMLDLRFDRRMFNSLRMRATSCIWSAVAACRCDTKEN